MQALELDLAPQRIWLTKEKEPDPSQSGFGSVSGSYRAWRQPDLDPENTGSITLLIITRLQILRPSPLLTAPAVVTIPVHTSIEWLTRDDLRYVEGLFHLVRVCSGKPLSAAGRRTETSGCAIEMLFVFPTDQPSILPVNLTSAHLPEIILKRVQ